VIAAVFCLLAILAITAWPVWKWISPTPVSASLFERTKAAVEKNPQLRPAWDKAMQDGVLTWDEAKDILEKAGEKPGPDE
jgi:hypothetical protein